jgi:sigma-54-dependent transcriptional regulator
MPEDHRLNLRERLEQSRAHLLLDCLRKNDGNQTLAARELACRAAPFSTASGA